MKLVSYNIQYGIGLDGRFDLDRIAANIADADIVALQEVTRHFSRNGGVDMVAGLAERLPGHFAAFGSGVDMDAGSSVENGRAVSRRFQFGNMVLSRFPVIATRNILLPRTRTFDRLNLQRSALEALIDAPGGPLRVYSVHLDHISADERIAQIAFLKARAFGYGEEGGAVSGSIEFGFPEPPHPEDFVLMGDFNMEPESIEYRAMTGTPDQQGRRALRAGHPLDALVRFSPYAEDAYSWIDMENSDHRQHLDYCFASPGLADRLMNAHVDLTAQGSDHFPVRVELAE